MHASVCAGLCAGVKFQAVTHLLIQLQQSLTECMLLATQCACYDHGVMFECLFIISVAYSTPDKGYCCLDTTCAAAIEAIAQVVAQRIVNLT